MPLTPDFFPGPELKALIDRSAPQRQLLADLYGRLPATRCLRRTRCCSLLPEISLIEALAVLEGLRLFPPEQRLPLLRKLVRYFFINPVEITSCPFLEGTDCLIYAERFFGCRAYGLWSWEEYQGRAGSAQQAKQHLSARWLNLGVRLPAGVVDFQIPYCREVRPTDQRPISDRHLLEAEEEIEKISEQINPGHRGFRDLYFSDLSFLITGLMVGIPEALRLKFTLVKEGLLTGTTQALDTAVRNLDLPGDFFYDLSLS